MWTQELRARLESLNRQRLPPRMHECHSMSRPTTPAELPPGNEVASAAGTHYRASEPVRAYIPLDGLGGAPQRLTATPLTGHAAAHPDLAALAAAFPSRTMFLDLETCGFAGSAIFLIGLIRHVRGRLIVEQMLARDYTEERSILDALWRATIGMDVLVTFNGKSFDWPMVRDRTLFHRLRRDDAASPSREQEFTVHCDLLHHARRRWKSVLPNCRLQTLERYVCGRLRRGDIPGSLIPAAYHQFVRTGDARQIVSVLHHNALDLITLVQLAVRMIGDVPLDDGAAPAARALSRAS